MPFQIDQPNDPSIGKHLSNDFFYRNVWSHHDSSRVVNNEPSYRTIQKPPEFDMKSNASLTTKKSVSNGAAKWRKQVSPSETEPGSTLSTPQTHFVTRSASLNNLRVSDAPSAFRGIGTVNPLPLEKNSESQKKEAVVVSTEYYSDSEALKLKVTSPPPVQPLTNGQSPSRIRARRYRPCSAVRCVGRKSRLPLVPRPPPSSPASLSLDSVSLSDSDSNKENCKSKVLEPSPPVCTRRLEKRFLRRKLVIV